jgi:glyoxylase-like metal-dependent hydrolase (beta-lactamase superfamily II)
MLASLQCGTLQSVAAWHEIDERVYVRRHPSYDLNVGLVVGGERCLVIDTRASAREGAELAGAVREVTDLPWLVVNTHAHFDHFLGNVAFADAEIWATHRGAKAIAAFDAETVVGEASDPDEVRTTPVVAPSRTFANSQILDLGERAVRLIYAGRGHTDNDVVVTAGDATFTGDLVEEGAPPAFEDAYPLDWPATLDVVIARAPDGPVVPGHGAVVDWPFVEELRDLLARVAQAGQSGHWSGVDLPDDVARIARMRCAMQLR